MKAMILAAGLGTRLRPLTNDRPKALVEVAGRTMLELTLRRLHAAGATQVIANTHHFADQMQAWLATHPIPGLRIEISPELVLLDTGGGLKNAAWFFQEPGPDQDQPFILHNVDVLSTIDLARMVRFHTDHSALATLAVQDRPTSRYLLFDQQGHLCGRRPGPKTEREPKSEPEPKLKPGLKPKRESDLKLEGEPKSEPKPELVRPVSNPQALAFSGIHVLSPRIFSLLEEEGAFPIIPAYLRLAVKGETIQAFPADQYEWRDLGRPEAVAQATQDIASGKLSTA